MLQVLLALGLALALGVLFIGFRILFQARRRYRGTMVVTCPETARPAAVHVDWRHAAATTAGGAPDLRLSDCSRWPERQGCGQDCLLQVESSPEDCQVRRILNRWYGGRTCVYCGWRFEDIHWHDHKPALLTPEGRTVEWAEVPPESLPAVLTTHRPVCWNCHVVETFRREHPDLVVERPPKPTAHRHV